MKFQLFFTFFLNAKSDNPFVMHTIGSKIRQNCMNSSGKQCKASHSLINFFFVWLFLPHSTIKITKMCIEAEFLSPSNEKKRRGIKTRFLFEMNFNGITLSKILMKYLYCPLSNSYRAKSKVGG